MNYKEIIIEEFEIIKQELINKYNEKGMRASGNFESSLEIKEKENGVELWGESYTEQLEKGRTPGKFPPFDAIRKWILNKNIDYENISLNSLAFLIARKISREGWNRENYGGVNLISEVFTPQRIQKIIDKVGTFEANKFIELVKIEFKQFV
jgi:hypothetical protein